MCLFPNAVFLLCFTPNTSSKWWEKVTLITTNPLRHFQLQVSVWKSSLTICGFSETPLTLHNPLRMDFGIIRDFFFFFWSQTTEAAVILLEGFVITSVPPQILQDREETTASRSTGRKRPIRPTWKGSKNGRGSRLQRCSHISTVTTQRKTALIKVLKCHAIRVLIIFVQLS